MQGQVVYYFQLLASFAGLGPTIRRLTAAPNLKVQTSGAATAAANCLAST